jgi:hypothetical protein
MRNLQPIFAHFNSSSLNRGCCAHASWRRQLFLRHGAGGYMLLPRKQVTVHTPTATS